MYERIWKKFKDDSGSKFVNSFPEALDAIHTNPKRYVYMGEGADLDGVRLNDPMCDITTLPETFFPSGLGIALPSGTPYKVFFDKM